MLRVTRCCGSKVFLHFQVPSLSYFCTPLIWEKRNCLLDGSFTFLGYQCAVEGIKQVLVLDNAGCEFQLPDPERVGSVSHPSVSLSVKWEQDRRVNGRVCMRFFTWNVGAQQMGNDLWVLITVIAITAHGAGPGLSLWFASGEATGEG